MIEILPLLTEFQSINDFEKDEIQTIIRNIDSKTLYDYPKTLQQSQTLVKSICKYNGINNSVNFDQNAIEFMYNIESYYETQFEEQNQYLTFQPFDQNSLHKIDDKTLIESLIKDHKIDHKIQFYLKKSDWYSKHCLFDIPETHPEQKLLLKKENPVLKHHFLTFIYDLLGTNQGNYDKQITQQCRLMLQTQDDSLTSSYLAFLKIRSIEFRWEMIKLISYLNVFRLI
jgi:hypothetical protein